HLLRRLGEGHVLVQSRPVEAVAFDHEVVEHHTARPEGARQHPHLTPSGVGAIPVPLQRHALILPDLHLVSWTNSWMFALAGTLFMPCTCTWFSSRSSGTTCSPMHT